jgi:hypothetical protein
MSPVRSADMDCCRIESMKMETVIRSPQKGIIAKLVHKEGACLPPAANVLNLLLTILTGYMQGGNCTRAL